jgi:hypothetical protein
MKNTEYFAFLTEIAAKNAMVIPLSEQELKKDKNVLNICVDDLLASEFIEYGLDENDELNEYGQMIEDAIDYFNNMRLAEI